MFERGTEIIRCIINIRPLGGAEKPFFTKLFETFWGATKWSDKSKAHYPVTSDQGLSYDI